MLKKKIEIKSEKKSNDNVNLNWFILKIKNYWLNVYNTIPRKGGGGESTEHPFIIFKTFYWHPFWGLIYYVSKHSLYEMSTEMRLP
jgi:hypothetical protein